MSYSSPFKKPEDLFCDDLTERMTRSAKWFLDDTSTKCELIFEKTKSLWEAALTLDFLIWRDKKYEEDKKNGTEKESAENVKKRRDKIKGMCTRAMEWLIRKDEEDPEKRPPYFGNKHLIWDTSVIISSIMNVIDYYDLEGDTEAVETINEGIKWLIKTCESENTEISTSVDDIAQVAIAIITLLSAKNSKIVEKQWLLKTSLDRFIDRLLASAHKYELKNKKGSEDGLESYYWTNCHNTAEVLEALSEYYSYLNNRIIKGERKQKVKEYIKSACLYLEDQENCCGNWSGSYTTLRCLYSYLRADLCIINEEKTKEQHYAAKTIDVGVVLRVIRWIIDEKHVFEDGSYLSTTFLTTFYVNAMMASIDWLKEEKTMMLPVEDRKIHHTYDYAITLDKLEDYRKSVHELESKLSLSNSKNTVLRRSVFALVIIILLFAVVFAIFIQDSIILTFALVIVTGVVAIIPNLFTLKR